MTSERTRLAARLAAGVCGLALISGCSVLVGPSPAATTPASTVAPPPVSAPASTPKASTPNASGTWVYELVQSASRPADATEGRARGTDTVFAHSTSLWAGCNGAVDEVVVRTAGAYRRLTGQLALRQSVPDGLVVHVLTLVDGNPVSNVQLDATDSNTVPVTLAITGARTITFQTKVVKGECGDASESYAFLGDGRVE